MDYEKQNWIDHIEDSETGEVFQEGTLFTAKRMNHIEEGIYQASSQIKDLANQTNDYLEKICVLMPESSSVDENTHILQSILDLAKDKNINLTVQFPAGYYELKTCVIYDNTTIKLTNNTTLKNVATPFFNNNFNVDEDIQILFFNAKPHDDNENTITGYDGRSNITIEGGIFETLSAICFIHGQNITLRNIKFKNANYDHYIQIGACKNVRIENCEFYGVTKRADDRQYVEFIQIDWATFESQPYWRSGTPIYDNCINDGIEIINCKFNKGTGDYAYLPACIGSHAGVAGTNNRNITIKGCEFNQFDYAALTLKYMDNVVVEDNKFLSTDNQDSYGITIDCCENVNIGKGNYFTGNARGLSIYNDCNKIFLKDFIMENMSRESDLILIGESNNIVVDGITFNNCTSTAEIIKSRNNHNVAINNCKVFDCTASQNFFANVYVNSSGSSSFVDVSNNKVGFAEVYFNPSVTNVKRTKEQFLWSGIKQSGTITLNDDIEKYHNLMATCDIYGNIMIPLVFIDNKCVIRTFNMPDSDNTLSISFFEVPLTINGRTITIGNIRELNFNNGNMSYVENSNTFYIKEIKGIKFRV